MYSWEGDRRADGRVAESRLHSVYMLISPSHSLSPQEQISSGGEIEVAFRPLDKRTLFFVSEVIEHFLMIPMEK